MFTSQSAFRWTKVVAAVALAGLVASAGPAFAGPAAQDEDAIVFVAGGGADLVRVAPDGSDRRPLTNTADIGERAPDWSPDGGQIAYSAPRADGPVQAASAIWVVARDVAGQPLTFPLTFGPDDHAPDWSPDGGRIAFASTLERGREQQVSSIAVIAPGSADQQLVLEPLAHPHAVIEQPRWSPDGRRLAFVVRVAGGATALNPGGELYIVNADGSGARRLFAHPGWDDADPAWSPDGRRIAFSSAHLDAGPGGDVRGGGMIWLLDPSTGAAEILLAEPDHPLESPKWSPDGRQLVIVRRPSVRPSGGETADAELIVVDVASPGVRRPLTMGRDPDWARRPLVPSPTPGPTGDGPTPTEGPSPATTPTPPVEPATPTPPPIPGLTPFPTLAPFPTLPPREPTLPPIVPTRPPTSMPTPTADASPTPLPTSTTSPSSTATGAAGGRIFLPLSLAAAPAGDPATPTVVALDTVTAPPADTPTAAAHAADGHRPTRR